MTDAPRDVALEQILDRCHICDKLCIPMADWETATCIRCDDEMAQLMLRATVGPIRDPLAPVARRDVPDVDGCGTPAGYLAHFAAGQEPCWPCFHFWQVAHANRQTWATRPDTERSNVA